MYTRPVGFNLKPVAGARERAVIDDSITALTVPASAVQAHCRLETAQIRFTLDGSDPSATVGRLLDIGGTLDLDNRGEITGFQGFRTGAVSGVLDIEYFTMDV